MHVGQCAFFFCTDPVYIDWSDNLVPSYHFFCHQPMPMEPLVECSLLIWLHYWFDHFFLWSNREQYWRIFWLTRILYNWTTYALTLTMSHFRMNLEKDICKNILIDYVFWWRVYGPKAMKSSWWISTLLYLFEHSLASSMTNPSIAWKQLKLDASESHVLSFIWLELLVPFLPFLTCTNSVSCFSMMQVDTTNTGINTDEERSMSNLPLRKQVHSR